MNQELQKISENLTLIPAPSVCLISSEKQLASLSNQERQIAQLLQHPSISQMPMEAFLLSVPKLIISINVITGWKMPDDDDVQAELIDQLTMLLKESFYFLTIPEIKFALRNYGTKIEDWGRSFNLSMFTKVLQQAVANRGDVVKIINQNTVPQLPTISDEQHKKEMKALVNQVYTDYLTHHKVSLVVASLYNTLEEDGKLPKDQYTLFADECLAKLIHQLHNDFNSYTMVGKREQAKEVGKLIDDVIEGQTTHTRVISCAKKEAVLQLFSQQQQNKVYHIYPIEK